MAETKAFAPAFAAHANLRTPESLLKAFPGETVTMMFPRALILTTNDHLRTSFPEGVHEVPLELADHWYLLQMGAKAYEKPVVTSYSPSGPVAATAMTDAHADFLQSRGYLAGLEGSERQQKCQQFFDRLSASDKVSFLMDYETSPAPTPLATPAAVLGE